MISRHKTKAIIGVSLWFAAIPLAIVIWTVGKKFAPPDVPNQTGAFPASLLLSFLAVQYFAFFWGGSQLALGKGYPTGILVWGILWPVQLIILLMLLFALRDRCSSSSRRMKRKYRRPAPS